MNRRNVPKHVGVRLPKVLQDELVSLGIPTDPSSRLNLQENSNRKLGQRFFLMQSDQVNLALGLLHRDPRPQKSR